MVESTGWLASARKPGLPCSHDGWRFERQLHGNKLRRCPAWCNPPPPLPTGSLGICALFIVNRNGKGQALLHPITVA